MELKINYTLQNIEQEHFSQFQRVIKSSQNLESLYYRYDFNDNVEEVLKVICDSICEHKKFNILHLQLLKCKLNFSALKMMENKLSQIQNLFSLTLNHKKVQLLQVRWVIVAWQNYCQLFLTTVFKY
ncbi:hypothetical protein ABPG72_019211 [Tetrahymena utriculariae]